MQGFFISSRMTYTFFATAPKALENLLADELIAMGAQQVKPTVAGVHFSGDLTTAYRICLWSRLANRVLLQLETITVTSQDDLYDGVKQVDWSLHLNPEGSFAVTFNAKNSQAITNSHFGALKVKDAIVDQMRTKFHKRPSIDTERPDIRVNINLNGETATVNLDLSGESLHRRGYRDVSIKAPIKENLAAALLIRSGWSQIAKQGGILVDPMCGSGTLLIEAAMIAADYAPGLLRKYFGCLHWQQHDGEAWRSLINEAKQRKIAGLSNLPVIVGFDNNRRNLDAAQNHLANAGLEKYIQLDCKPVSAAAPNESWQPGLVICNPPYGERLGDAQETALLYKQFGDTLRANFKHWQAAMIVSDTELGFRMGIRSQKPITFYNGALECKLLRMSIEDSAFFEPKPLTADERIARINTLIDNPYHAFIAKKDNDKIVENESEHVNNDSLYKGKHKETQHDVRLAIAGVSKDQEQGQGAANTTYRSPDFANRVKKNLKSLSAWKTKNHISCYRIYDADLPEYAAAIDLYEGEETWVNVQEYEPPKNIDPGKANQRLVALLVDLPKVLGIPKENVFLKIRRKQKQSDQYEKLGDQGNFHVIEEHGCRLQVNFNDYLDTGLFLDHRPVRLLIQQQSQGKRFLNLFAYTGSATVHAAVGDALATTTVDMSKTYLEWAKANLVLNLTVGKHELIQADCLEWLAKESAHPYPRQYDLIFLDPPTFSNSKRMTDIFDIQKDHIDLIKQALRLLDKDGILYFSTNFRRFKLDHDALAPFTIEEISAQTIPPDFARNPRIHYCWRISH